MDVIIEEFVSTVRAVDGTTLLDARVLARIVHAVMGAMDATRAHDKRRQADTSTNTPTAGRSE
jgi:hypothetical protein